MIPDMDTESIAALGTQRPPVTPTKGGWNGAVPPLRHQLVTCILNGAAGSHHALQAKNQLPDLFRRHGAEARILLARDGSEIGTLAHRAVEERSAVVVAGGGDGTMNCVAGALVGTETAMGILPLGTLNHFAKDLKIPLNIEAAVATTVTGQLARIDVGEVNGRIFLNNSSIGIYPWIVRERQKEEGEGYGKWGAFGRAVLSVLHRYSLLDVHLRVDDQEEPKAKTPFVFIGNNRYESAGLSIGHRKALDAGQLWVCWAPPDSRSKLLLLALQHLVGTQRDADLAIFEAQQVSVRTKTARLAVAVDGEVTFLNTPLRYRTRPRALDVIVPVGEGSSRSA
jgi:diacylglycerol kinase family enzyme